MEAAFFDLDKTVIARASMVAFGKPLYRAGLLSRWLLLRALYGQLVYLYLGADEARMAKMREAALRVTKGWSRDHIRVARARDPRGGHRADHLRRGARPDPLPPGRRAARCSSSRRHPRRSSTRWPSTSASTTSIATRPEVDEHGRYSGGVDFYSYGPYKVDGHARRSAERDGIDLDASYAYSDSVTDIPMLEAVGHPVAVNPDRDLARHRRRAGLGGPDLRASGADAGPGVDADPGPDGGDQRGPGRHRGRRGGVLAAAAGRARAVGRWEHVVRPGRDERPDPGAEPPYAGAELSGFLELLRDDHAENHHDQEQQQLLHAGQPRGGSRRTVSRRRCPSTWWAPPPSKRVGRAIPVRRVRFPSTSATRRRRERPQRQRFCRVPIPSMWVSNTSPGARKRPSAMPTPGGVPVKIRSPGKRVRIPERYSISVGTSTMRPGGAVVLADLAVDRARQGQVGGVGDEVGGHDHGTDRPVAVPGLAQVEVGRRRSELQGPVRDVLAHGQAGDVVPGVGRGDVPPAGADDHDQLHLVVDGVGPQLDVGRRADEAARELGEDQRCGRDVDARLLGVGAVVEADAEALPGSGHRGAEGGRVDGAVRGRRRRGPSAASWSAAGSASGHVRVRQAVVAGDGGQVVPVPGRRPPGRPGPSTFASR